MRGQRERAFASWASRCVERRSLRDGIPNSRRVEMAGVGIRCHGRCGTIRICAPRVPQLTHAFVRPKLLAPPTPTFHTRKEWKYTQTFTSSTLHAHRVSTRTICVAVRVQKRGSQPRSASGRTAFRHQLPSLSRRVYLRSISSEGAGAPSREPAHLRSGAHSLTHSTRVRSCDVEQLSTARGKSTIDADLSGHVHDPAAARRRNPVAHPERGEGGPRRDRVLRIWTRCAHRL